jgi:hypothetical protein
MVPGTDVNNLYSKNDIYNKIIFFYIMLDFLLSYFGINYIGCIEEANPAMTWLFELPFILALNTRIIIGTIIYELLRFIQVNTEITYKCMLIFALGVENYIIFLHATWLTLYF